MTHTIGNIALNVSLVLYFVTYLPQIIHNQIHHRLSGLSFYFHYLLFISCTTDLIYGIGVHMPWQYRLVSIVSVCYLFIQHLQIKKIASNQSYHYATYFFIIVLIAGLLCLYFFKQDRLPFIAFGYFSEVTGWISCFPQLIKNMDSTSALSLSFIYLLLDLFSNVCDNISAWAFAWPVPSKLDAIFFAIIGLALMYQWMRARRRLVSSPACRSMISG